MRNSKFISLIKINSAIVILNIVLFSPGLLNIEIGGRSIFKTALGVTIIIMSIIIFIIGNYSILMKEDNDINLNECKLKNNYTIRPVEINSKTPLLDIKKNLELLLRKTSPTH